MNKMLTLENKKELLKVLSEKYFDNEKGYEKKDYKEDYYRIVNNVSCIYTNIDSLHDFGYDYIKDLVNCSKEATKIFERLQWVIDFEKFVWYDLMHTNKYIYLEKSRIVIELE